MYYFSNEIDVVEVVFCKNCWYELEIVNIYIIFKVFYICYMSNV